jgi:hypothetical protein
MNQNKNSFFSTILHPRLNDKGASDREAFTREEEGSLFYWAWPELLGWKLDFEWLFSPVVGRTWPGDLWGIDEDGSLLLVETKRGDQAQDPMLDFVGYLEAQPVKGTNPLYSTNLVLERWNDLLKYELSFIRKSQDSDGDLNWWNDTHLGVVPYSSKRFAVCKWPTVYLDYIAPRIKAPTYKKKVRSWLDKRSKISNPGVHFFGLFSVPPGGYPRLSTKGKENYLHLRNEVDDKTLHWRAVGINIVNADSAEIIGWDPHFDNI